MKQNNLLRVYIRTIQPLETNGVERIRESTKMGGGGGWFIVIDTPPPILSQRWGQFLQPGEQKKLNFVKSKLAILSNQLSLFTSNFSL